MAAELPLCGKPRAEATTFSIDQLILEVMKKETNKRQLAMTGLCVGWKVHKAGWKVCCWKVCWWQLAMAGLLCGVAEWAMEGACVHLVSTSGVLGSAFSLS